MSKQSVRSIEKSKQRRKDKEQRAVSYLAMAQSGDNTKRKKGNATGNAGLRQRDESCKNIGDLKSHPQMLDSAIALFIKGEYTGHYKGYLDEQWHAMARNEPQRLEACWNWYV